MTILPTGGGNWPYNLHTVPKGTYVLGMAINAPPVPRGFKDPLQKNSSRQQLLKGSTSQCAGINTLDWKVLLSQFFPWLHIGGHHTDNSQDQEVYHPLTGEQCWAETFCTFWPRDGQVPVHTQGTRTEHLWRNWDIMSEMGGEKKKSDILVGNYITRSVA